MNQDRFKKGIEDLKNLKLSREEKSLLFSRLDNYAVSPKMIVSPKIYWFESVFHSHYTQMALIAVLLFGGGGIILGSNNALPGELLYPLKVNVSEPIQGISLINNSSKINWEIEKLGRRFEEVEVLAVQGKLDEKKSAEAQTRIEDSRVSFNALVQAEESKNENEIADFHNNLEAKETAHQKILEKVENHSEPSSKDEIAKFRMNVVARNQDATSNSAPASTGLMMMSAKMAPQAENVSTSTYNASTSNVSNIATTTYKKKKKIIEEKIKTLEKLKSSKKLDEKTSTLKKEVLEDFKADLEEAQRAFKEAENKAAEGNIEEAVQDLENSSRNIESADVSLRQGLRFGVEASRK